VISVILTIVAGVLFMIAGALLRYGINNIYGGPCDWRGVASLWLGFIPFAAGLLILIFHVFPLSGGCK